jgi:hypothetical protein
MSEATALLKAGIQACKRINAKQCLAGLLRSGRSHGLASKLASRAPSPPYGDSHNVYYVKSYPLQRRRLSNIPHCSLKMRAISSELRTTNITRLEIESLVSV